MPKSKANSSARSLAYLDLAQRLRERILQGDYPADSYLPSERALAVEWNASRQTVRQALLQLRREELVASEHGRGNRVLQESAAEASNELSVAPYAKLAALVIYDITHGGAMSICQGAASAIQQEGYHLIVAEVAAHVARRAEEEAAQIRALIDKGVRGLLIYAEPTDKNRGLLLEAMSKGMSVVQIDRYLAGLPCDYVGVENVAAAEEMTEHLMRGGHNRIAFLSFHNAASTCRERLQGYRNALYRRGLPVEEDLVAYCDPRKEKFAEITRIIREWAASPDPPTAIFAVNDEVALEASKALNALGASLPRQMALVGFDNLPATALVSPALTTVAQPFYDLGRAAAQLLLSRLQNDFAGEPRTVRLPTRLVVRQSCGVDALPFAPVAV